MGCSACNDNSSSHKCKKNNSDCEGCACSILRNADSTDRFLILLKGTSEFLPLGPGASPQATEFRFVSFNPENCCATFVFTERGPQPRTLNFVVDCRCICALAPLPV